MPVLIMTFNANALAALDMHNQTQVGRYLTVANVPFNEQKNLMRQTIQVRFPQNVQTIGEAINYVLRFSGYSLIPAMHRNEALKIILTKSLPAIDRNYGPMSLRDALNTLVGEPFDVIQDPINRTVDFQLKSAYVNKFQPNTKPHYKK